MVLVVESPTASQESPAPKVTLTEADQVIEQVNTMAPQSRLEPDVQMTRTVSNEIMEMDGVIRIGRLRCSRMLFWAW